MHFKDLKGQHFVSQSNYIFLIQIYTKSFISIIYLTNFTICKTAIVIF